MKKIIIISVIFFLDRIIKIYLLNLQENGTDIDFYINSFLNFYLVWNSGIGFGLVSMEADIYYHILTVIIALVNVALVYLLVKSNGLYASLAVLTLNDVTHSADNTKDKSRKNFQPRICLYVG